MPSVVRNLSQNKQRGQELENKRSRERRKHLGPILTQEVSMQEAGLELGFGSCAIIPFRKRRANVLRVARFVRHFYTDQSSDLDSLQYSSLCYVYPTC